MRAWPWRSLEQADSFWHWKGMRTACVMSNFWPNPTSTMWVLVGLGQKLVVMILKVFSNCNDSVILFFSSLNDSLILFNVCWELLYEPRVSFSTLGPWCPQPWHWIWAGWVTSPLSLKITSHTIFGCAALHSSHCTIHSRKSKLEKDQTHVPHTSAHVSQCRNQPAKQKALKHHWETAVLLNRDLHWLRN